MRKALALMAFSACFGVVQTASTVALAQDAAFAPGGATVSLAVTGTTARVQFQAGPTSKHVRLYNGGTVAVFIACGDVTVTAAVASGMPVAPGSVEVLGCAQTYIAGISGGTAATLYITPGAGL